MPEKYKPPEGVSLPPGQRGANSAEPSFAGWAGSGGGAGDDAGGEAGRGSGAGGGDGVGGGLGGGGAGAAGERSGVAACFGFGFFFRRWRRVPGLELAMPPRRPGWSWGLARCRLGRGLSCADFGGSAFDGTSTSARSTLTRGNPTSSANGGGSGGLSNEGTTCNASNPTPARATPLPKVTQRIRIPLIPAQDRNPGDSPPTRQIKQLTRARCSRRGGVPTPPRPSTPPPAPPRYPATGRQPNPPDSASR
jgi:hypothetical protein